MPVLSNSKFRGPDEPTLQFGSESDLTADTKPRKPNLAFGKVIPNGRSIPHLADRFVDLSKETPAGENRQECKENGLVIGIQQGI